MQSQPGEKPTRQKANPDQSLPESKPKPTLPKANPATYPDTNSKAIPAQNKPAQSQPGLKPSWHKANQAQSQSSPKSTQQKSQPSKKPTQQKAKPAVSFSLLSVSFSCWLVCVISLLMLGLHQCGACRVIGKQQLLQVSSSCFFLLLWQIRSALSPWHLITPCSQDPWDGGESWSWCNHWCEFSFKALKYKLV